MINKPSHTFACAISALLILFSIPAMAQFPDADTAYFYLYGSTQIDEFRDVDNVRSDSGYIALGTTSSFTNGNGDFYLVRTDWKGNTIWSRNIGSVNIEKGHAVKQTPDGGFILGGYTNNTPNGNYDMYVVKTDTQGFVVWQKHFGGPDWDFLYSIALAPDSGFILCGESYSFGNNSADVYLVRTDKDGNVIWERTYGGVNKDGGNKVIVTYDNNLAIAGYTDSYGFGMRDGYFLKCKLTNGDTLFTKTFGGNLNEEFYSIAQHNFDSGFVMVGYNESYSLGFKDFYSVKCDSLGNFKWQDSNGGTSGDDVVTGISNIGIDFFVSGYTVYGGGVYDLRGAILNFGGWWLYLYSNSYGGSEADYSWANKVTLKNDFLMAGSMESFGAINGDALLTLVDSLRGGQTQLVKTSSDTLVSVEEQVFHEGFSMYPNPARDFVWIQSYKEIIKIEVYDLQGNLIVSPSVSNDQVIKLNIAGFSPGVYFVRTTFRDAVYSRKIIFGGK